MNIWWYVGFTALVMILLVLDLKVFHREAHEVRPREAALWSAFWVALSLLFNLFVYFEFGHAKAVDFLTGYLIEKSLSVDNLFVFVLIFSYFQVPKRLQHRVLFWGILGAFVLRALLIGVGAVLISQFSWIIYVFGAFLVYTGVRMAFEKETSVEVEANPVIRMLRRWFRVVGDYSDATFFVRDAGRLAVTPLFVVLVMIESTDVIFALDSIPAIFAITTDTFIVFTSNIFAILGLRALYFLLANVVDQFHYLKYGLAVVLTYIGAKMLLTMVDVHIPTGVSLGVVGLVLLTAIALSLVFPKEVEEHHILEHDMQHSDDEEFVGHATTQRQAEGDGGRSDGG